MATPSPNPSRSITSPLMSGRQEKVTGTYRWACRARTPASVPNASRPETVRWDYPPLARRYHHADNGGGVAGNVSEIPGLRVFYRLGGDNLLRFSALVFWI